MRAVLWGGWKWGAQQRPEAASSLTEEAWLGHLVGGVSGDGERGPGQGPAGPARRTGMGAREGGRRPPPPGGERALRHTLPSPTPPASHLGQQLEGWKALGGMTCSYPGHGRVRGGHAWWSTGVLGPGWRGDMWDWGVLPGMSGA